jgi:hypothetical protein
MSNEQDQNNDGGSTPYTEEDHQPLSVLPMTDAPFWARNSGGCSTEQAPPVGGSS